MPTYKLKGGVYQNVDEVGLDGLSPILINGYVDEFDNTCKRPGYENYVNLGVTHPVRGLFYWQQKGCVIAVANGRVYKITATKDVIDKTTNALTNLTNPAIFASDGGATWIATGERMVLLDWNISESNAIFVDDTNAPTAVSHVAYLDGYTICNKVGSGQFFWTSPTDRASWNALDTASAEAHPDTIVALHTFWRELYLFGQATTEVWYNSGTPNFSRLGGGLIEVGCSAPYSIIRLGGTIFWLDHMRRFIRLNGRNTEHVSQPIQKQLDALPFVADCVAYPVSTRGRNWIILNFPFSNKTYCYDIDLNQWAEWGEWSSGSNRYNFFGGISSSSIGTAPETMYISSIKEPSTGANACETGLIAWSDPTYIQSGVSGAAMASYATGLVSQTRYAGITVDTPCSGQIGWQFYASAQGEPDLLDAFVTLPYFYTSYCIRASNFGFNIPSNAIISGIYVTTYGRCGSGSDVAITETTGSLIKPNGEGGSRRYSDYWKSAINSTQQRGYWNDLWDLTWTPAEINDNNLKFEVAVLNVAYEQTHTVRLDAIRITVYYIVFDPSCYLTATNFGFSIPSGAIIQGVQVGMNLESAFYPSGTQGAKDKTAQLVVSGSRAGNNLSENTFLTTNTQKIYGNINSTWGLTLTPAIVNSSNFGFAFQVEVCSSVVKVYELYIAIYYSFQSHPFSVGTSIFIGHKSNGKIYEIKNDTFKDDTIPVRLKRLSGSITHNTLRTKRCKKLSMRFKRGVGTVETPSPSFQLRHKTDMKDWSHVETIDMGGQTDTYGFQDLHRLGIYKSRQYEIVHEQPTDFIFIEGEEESEVLLT